MPGGLILGGLGLAYLAVSLGICSDSLFVTLTRRELSTYFLSPIGYLVIIGMVLMQWLSYFFFVETLIRRSAGGRGALPEPIVQFYFVAIFPVFALIILVLVMINLRKERIPNGLWGGLLFLTVANVCVAAIWHAH